METLTKFKTKKEFKDAINAFQFVCNLSENEIETLEILSGHKKLIEQSIMESKKKKIHPIESIL